MTWQKFMDISSLIGTIIGIITYIQALNISKQLRKQKMELGFKSQLSSLKSKLNTTIDQITEHEIDNIVIKRSYETITIINQFAESCEWNKKDIKLIKECMDLIKEYSKQFDKNDIDLSKTNDINSKLIEVKSLLIKEENLL